MSQQSHADSAIPTPIMLRPNIHITRNQIALTYLPSLTSKYPPTILHPLPSTFSAALEAMNRNMSRSNPSRRILNCEQDIVGSARETCRLQGVFSLWWTFGWSRAGMSVLSACGSRIELGIVLHFMPPWIFLDSIG